MKFKFINQDFQTKAVNSVCDLFQGQEKRNSTFSVIQEKQISAFENKYGYGNAMLIDDDTLLKNMRNIQKKSNLPLTSDLEERQFCVEMETGTGKTYVYTKTIFELNKRYGFTKFIIVVPSVAIREGVFKSLQITGEHFGSLYNNVPTRYFVYNSAKLNDVKRFATNNNIEIMIINIDAFKKAENIINQEQDKLNGETAMRYIQDTNPIVIIDEPQSVDNTPKAKEAVASLNPMCVFRYSATHREKINLLYRLTPVDAYQMGLVKQIVVSSTQVADDYNKPYIKLLSVSYEKGKGFKARIELDVRDKKGVVVRKAVTAKPNDDLFLLSGKRDLYNGYSIDGIDCTPQRECIELSTTDIVKVGKSIGGIDDNIIKKEQIKRTIEAHFDKELLYLKKGIKVLSLFFIDEVKKYRTAEGEKGIYAQMFEDCYEEFINLPKYKELKDRFSINAANVHNGYFSQDKKGVFKDTKGNTLADDNTYNIIMRDKELLLSFECPLRFIWSHSALKEGWDNTNVFQVCTLIEQKSTLTCRQKIGRGLRLCVNQNGERIDDKDINVLHVVANESFSEFADTLQREIEQETGIKFGILEIGMFSGVIYNQTKIIEKKITKEQAEKAVEVMKTSGIIKNDGKIKDINVIDNIELPKELEPIKEVIKSKAKIMNNINTEILIDSAYQEEITEEKVISYDNAVEIINHFEKKDYITKTGKIKDTMKNDLINGNLDVPKKFEAAKERLESIIIKANDKLPVRDGSKEVTVKLKKQVILSPEFRELWNKIKQKTMYELQIDTDKLVEKCIEDLKKLSAIPKARILTQTADIDIEKSGIRHREKGMRASNLEVKYPELPDILDIVSEECFILPSYVYRMLIGSGRSIDFLNNPQLFLEKFIEIVRDNISGMVADGIKYVKVAGKEYYIQEIFEMKELKANLDKNVVAVNNSVYDYIVYDSSTVEKPFALALDNDPDVKLFFKLPKRFKIDTPIGSYNPDWVVYIDKDGTEKLYFVIETKGNTNINQLRLQEQVKIKCGKKHFKAVGDIDMDSAKDWSTFKKNHVI